MGPWRQLFLDGAGVVCDALGHPSVPEAWNEPSVLEEQTVGSLCGHLARGGVWVVADYLDADLPAPATAIDFETAADYYSAVGPDLDEAAHRAIRARGAAVAADGPEAVVHRLTEAIAGLQSRLDAEPDDRTLAVYGGRVMRLDDYLWTRLVEQVVHLDDLARSIDVDPWPLPADAAQLVIAIGAETGRRRHGDAAMIRALYRDDPSALPVL